MTSGKTNANNFGERHLTFAPLGKQKSDYLISDMQERSVYLTDVFKEDKSNQRGPTQYDRKHGKEVAANEAIVHKAPEAKVKRPKTRRKVQAHDLPAADESAIIERRVNDKDEMTPKKSGTPMKVISEGALGHWSGPAEKKSCNQKKPKRRAMNSKERKQQEHLDEPTVLEVKLKETPKKKN